MLKTRIEDIKPKEKEPEWEYPCIAQHKSNKGLIMLFVSKEKTIAITIGNSLWEQFECGKQACRSDFVPLKNKRIIIEC